MSGANNGGTGWSRVVRNGRQWMALLLVSVALSAWAVPRPSQAAPSSPSVNPPQTARHVLGGSGENPPGPE